MHHSNPFRFHFYVRDEIPPVVAAHAAALAPPVVVAGVEAPAVVIEVPPAADNADDAHGARRERDDDPPSGDDREAQRRRVDEPASPRRAVRASGQPPALLPLPQPLNVVQPAPLAPVPFNAVQLHDIAQRLNLPTAPPPLPPVPTFEVRVTDPLPEQTLEAARARVAQEYGCGVCHDVVVAPHVLTACSHVFCGECITTWADRQMTCPACRVGFVKPAYDRRADDLVGYLLEPSMDETELRGRNERKQRWVVMQTAKANEARAAQEARHRSMDLVYGINQAIANNNGEIVQWSVDKAPNGNGICTTCFSPIAQDSIRCVREVPNFVRDLHHLSCREPTCELTSIRNWEALDVATRAAVRHRKLVVEAAAASAAANAAAAVAAAADNAAAAVAVAADAAAEDVAALAEAPAQAVADPAAPAGEA